MSICIPKKIERQYLKINSSTTTVQLLEFFYKIFPSKPAFINISKISNPYIHKINLKNKNINGELLLKKLRSSSPSFIVFHKDEVICEGFKLYNQQEFNSLYFI